jgi:hypothetical protein
MFCVVVLGVLLLTGGHVFSLFCRYLVAARSEARTLIARTPDRGLESHLRHGCLSSCVYVVLSCVGRGLATS